MTVSDKLDSEPLDQIGTLYEIQGHPVVFVVGTTQEGNYWYSCVSVLVMGDPSPHPTRRCDHHHWTRTEAQACATELTVSFERQFNAVMIRRLGRDALQ